MEIRAITVNAASLTAAQKGIQAAGLSGADKARTESKDTFAPECRVTISQEGKNLSRRQAETEVRSSQGTKSERMLQRLQQEQDTDGAYRDGLDEIDSKVRTRNSTVLSDEDFIKQQKKLEGMRNLRAYQAEQNQKNAKEAREMASQYAEYQDKIDENNRELLTLLRSMKEAEKAEEEQEDGKTAAGGSGVVDGSGGNCSKGGALFGTENSAGDVIQGAAVQFMMSSAEREWGAQEGFADMAGEGRWMIDHANDIAQNILIETENLRAALDDEAFSDERLDEMMRLLQDGTKNQWFAEEARKRGWAIGMELNLKDIKNYRYQGLQNLTLAKGAKEQHDEKNPLGGMMQTKKDIAQSAIDADLGVARRDSLDGTSRELEGEVKKLIDERNDVDGASKSEEEEKRQVELQEEQQEKLREKQQTELQAGSPSEVQKRDEGTVQVIV